MIPVTPEPEPPNFDRDVRQPGLRAIAEMVGKRPPTPRTRGKPYQQIAQHESDIPSKCFPSYWTGALDDLMTAYNEVCAYSCFRIHPVTGARSTDHFAPKSQEWRRVYEWDNYRLACSRINSRKCDFSNVLDPFTIKNGWFRLELVGFQVLPNPYLRRAERAAIQDTIDQLRLNDFCKDREQDAEEYWSREIALSKLRRESPFVAYELRRQKRLLPGDTW